MHTSGLRYSVCVTSFKIVLRQRLWLYSVINLYGNFRSLRAEDFLNVTTSARWIGPVTNDPTELSFSPCRQ